MVGVPRSAGCCTCIQRRVKCDQEQPECRRCRDRNVECGGYQRRLTFYHQTPASIGGRKRKEVGQWSSSNSRSRAKDASAARVIAMRPSMDTLQAPSLATAATDVLMKEVFGSFVLTCFPGLFSTWKNRVDINWMEFVRHHMDTSSHALLWSIRSLSTWYLGQTQQNQDIILSSRHMYGHGLRHLIRLLGNPRSVTSNGTLMAAIHLGIYEMLDGLGNQRWLVHARGIGKLFRLRGAAAHRAGFGRTLLLAYRAFLVADAFIGQEACFLAEHEWRTMMHESVVAERRSGGSSPLVETIEFAFNEIVLCPGLFIQVRDLVAARDVSAIQRESLVAQIMRSRDRLCGLETQMESLLGKPAGEMTVEEDREDAIPEKIAIKVARFGHQGMRSAIAMLSQLLTVLDVAESRTTVDSSSGSMDHPWNLSMEIEPSAEVEAERPNPEDRGSKPQDQLDELALSMGMMRT